MIIKILTELGKRKDEHSENFNKEMENIRKHQTEVTQMKNTLKWFKLRPDGAEEKISQLRDKAVELTQSEQQKRKKNEKI